MSEYRYTLTRDLGEGRDEVLVWVMLNPSTADETVDEHVRPAIAEAYSSGRMPASLLAIGSGR